MVSGNPLFSESDSIISDAAEGSGSSGDVLGGTPQACSIVWPNSRVFWALKRGFIFFYLATMFKNCESPRVSVISPLSEFSDYGY